MGGIGGGLRWRASRMLLASPPSSPHPHRSNRSICARLSRPTRVLSAPPFLRARGRRSRRLTGRRAGISLATSTPPSPSSPTSAPYPSAPPLPLSFSPQHSSTRSARSHTSNISPYTVRAPETLPRPARWLRSGSRVCLSALRIWWRGGMRRRKECCGSRYSSLTCASRRG
ncbi:hypothetical protein AAT19DRAFT_16706 [Rhodotorula toruloides]|uniref:Uncharacterized protein n=1 Tax=Rhodotorula toruloides TaxID=5286 RepID=A0A2T0A438_RHOTO|nr:hypothetical protein AAT19DRAFT_16706 [Rhodotorula toruloides]